MSMDRHNVEIKKNREVWGEKPLLRLIYTEFFREILDQVNRKVSGEVMEIGSGMGNLKNAFAECVSTDVSLNPWIDRAENAYWLSSADSSVSNLILFDVFHHLASPGAALREFKRVLVREGRIIIFEPYLSVLGLLVYGLFHHEPLALFKKINWGEAKEKRGEEDYYAAQGNATRIFGNSSRFKKQLSSDWSILLIKKYSALSYVLSGGFSRPAFYQERSLPIIKKIERILDFFPTLFATRILIVMEKK